MPTGRVRNKTRNAGLVDPRRQRAADRGGFVLLVGEPAKAEHELREFMGAWQTWCLADFGTNPGERGSQSVIDAHEASSIWATACQGWQFMPLGMLGV